MMTAYVGHPTFNSRWNKNPQTIHSLLVTQFCCTCWYDFRSASRTAYNAPVHRPKGPCRSRFAVARRPLDLELRRLTLARSYEFSERLADEINDRDTHKTKAQDFGTFAAVARLDMLSNFIEKTCEMRPTALALTFLAVLASLRPASAGSESQDLLSKLSITQQSWSRSGRLLIANITFRNDNSFPVHRVVVSCQITGDPARPQDSRGVTVRQDVSRGNMTVSGIEFPVTDDKAQGGPCKVDSAERAR
jgi:hypothetical protein